MAEVALYLEFRKPQCVEEVAALCGKSVEETSKILWEIAVAGASLVGNKDGVDKYWLEIWVPGHMELIVNHPHKENINNFTQIGQAFDEYGKRKAPMA
ncbi:pyridine nucleotide-disulfide oxidoreductase, partial [Clostridium perfringens]|nr:pyridine nucleotide-disulfide oxidoreductase [Clostridium perfringens]